MLGKLKPFKLNNIPGTTVFSGNVDDTDTRRCINDVSSIHKKALVYAFLSNVTCLSLNYLGR